MTWRRFADTSLASPADICKPGEETLIGPQKRYPLSEWSAAVLVGRAG